MAKKAKIGDVFEIPTNRGLAYAQVSHFHPEYSALVRVLSGDFEERPTDFARIVKDPERFVTFIPLQAALKRGIFHLVANAEVPEFASSFPVFRTGLIDPRIGKVRLWWFWDGEREWKVGNITEAQRKLPIRGIWNDTLLIERIESGWTPQSDPA